MDFFKYRKQNNVRIENASPIRNGLPQLKGTRSVTQNSRTEMKLDNEKKTWLNFGQPIYSYLAFTEKLLQSSQVR